MALSRPQQIMIKRAQAQLKMPDEEYRTTIMPGILPGCSSSKDPRLADEHFDRLLKFLEYLYWSMVDRKELTHAANGPFLKRNYWKDKNTKESTSRDRYTGQELDDRIRSAEVTLARMGYGQGYLRTIRYNTGQAGEDSNDPVQKRKYLMALERTVESKRKKQPFTQPR